MNPNTGFPRQSAPGTIIYLAPSRRDRRAQEAQARRDAKKAAKRDRRAA